MAYYNGATPTFDATYGLEKFALYGLENIEWNLYDPNFDDNGDGILVVVDTVDPTHPELRDISIDLLIMQHLLLKKILFVMGTCRRYLSTKEGGLGL